MPAIREKQGGGAANQTSFKPGQSGNPAGRPKETEAVRKAKEGMSKMTPQVVKQMQEALNDPETKLSDKIKIWEIIFDRVMGKPQQAVEVDAKNIPQVIFVGGDKVAD